MSGERDDGASSPWRIAARLNSFRRDGIGVIEAMRRMIFVPGLTAFELNYPQHFEEPTESELR